MYFHLEPRLNDVLNQNGSPSISRWWHSSFPSLFRGHGHLDAEGVSLLLCHSSFAGLHSPLELERLFLDDRTIYTLAFLALVIINLAVFLISCIHRCIFILTVNSIFITIFSIRVSLGSTRISTCLRSTHITNFTQATENYDYLCQ